MSEKRAYCQREGAKSQRNEPRILASLRLRVLFHLFSTHLTKKVRIRNFSNLSQQLQYQTRQAQRLLAVRQLCLFCFLSLFTLFLAGCQPQSPQVVKIGLVAPFEGQDREIGYDGIYAARLAVREFNQAQSAGSGNVRVALVALDDSGNVDIAAGNAQALATDPSIIAIVGMGSEPTRLATAENLADASIPLLHIGVSPFVATSSDQLPADFKERYAAITPFDEVAGDQAGSVYDAFSLIFAGIEILNGQNRPLTAENLAEISNSVKIQSITGQTLVWDQSIQ